MKKGILFIVVLFAMQICVAQKSGDMRKVEIQLIRNATLKLNYAGKTILVDPMLSAKHSFMSFVEQGKDLNPTLDLPVSAGEVVKGIDAVLLTHAYPDHLDPKAVEVLPKEIPFFAQVADKEAVEKMPFQQLTLVEDEAKYDEITITRTNGKHGPKELLEVLGTVSGYVLRAENNPTIYIVGDCLLDADVEQAIEKYNPDIIVTNSGGAMFMGENRILMDVQETIAVAKKAPKVKVVAVHMEVLDHCTVTRESMKAEAEKAGVEIIIPKDGETVVL